MDEKGIRSFQKSHTIKGPYENLYIFEIEGTAKPSKETFQQDYLGCWKEGSYSFLFFTSDRKAEVDAFVAKNPAITVRSEMVLKYDDWEGGEELVPFKIDNLSIFPYWEDVEEKEGDIRIKLDPGVIFGSGGHPSTRKSLEALKWIYSRHCPTRVLDLGTGTGILAICAAKLGAEWVLAVDNNDLAIETARKNVKINHVQGRIDLRLGEAAEHLTEGADLLCANIAPSVIHSFLSMPAFYTKRWYVLSGLVGTEVNKVLQRLDNSPIEVVQVLSDKLWFTIIGNLFR
jgi:ribosomal protein L11 methyltransferase